MFLLIVLLAMLEQVWTDYSNAKLEMKTMKDTPRQSVRGV